MKYEQFLADVVQSLAEVDSMGRTLSRVKSVLSATHDLVEKNGRLEKENAGLRDELDDWKGNAEGFHPDAYMKLPVDADGVPIGVGDIVYRDDDPEPLQVDLIYAGSMGYRAVRLKDGAGIYTSADAPRLSHRKPEPLEPEPADSWEKLEEDARKQSCSYFGLDLPPALCDDCPHGSRQTGRACWQNARLDMIARAKKLAGIEGEAQR